MVFHYSAMPLLNGKTEINDAAPLPQFDGSFARAYAAKSKSNDQALLAYVCVSPIGVRGDMVNALRGVNHPSLLRLRDSGTFEWPHSGGRAFAFIYDMPPGEPLAPASGAVAPMKEESLIANLAQPLFAALNELSRVGIFHGGMRARNVFIGEGQKAVLGDGLAAPSGSGQPAVYETADRGMAEGLARGAGTSSDDYYALGVTLLTALLGDEPLRGQSPQSIVNLKLERGSYAALAGERRFSPAMIELLRGLLADDPRQRWSFADFEMWVDGKRLTPKQSMPSKKASRAIVFAGHNYFQPRQLALALAGNVPLAALAIQSDEVGRWLKNGLGDDEVLKSYEAARLLTKRQRTGPEEERLVANVVLALDPRGPIRYRGLSVFPSGMAACMAQAVLNDAPLQPFMEIISNDMPERWLQGQVEKKPDIIGLVQQVQRAKDFAEKQGLGFGPERAFYEINLTQPCLSPMIRNSYAMTIQQLLEALDKRGGFDNGNILDRHSSAFILARDRKTMPQIMRLLESAPDMARKGQGLLTLFADLQYRAGPASLRNLAKALLPLADETVRRFQNRPRQGKIREALRPAVEAGDIGAMLKLVDDPDTLTLDAQEYEAARYLYRETEAEIQRLGGEGADKKMLAEQAGQPLAAALSVGLGFVLAAFLLLRAFLSTMGG